MLMCLIHINHPFISFSGAGSVIHSHSKNALMATLFYEGKEFQISHIEVIKGIKKCKSGEFVSIPVH